ncbi:MAG: hypothetical protein ACI4L6_00325 [Candidatus Onthoplasma sp.]
MDKLLITALKNQDEFYLVCDYTINSNFHMPSTEQDFIDSLIKKLKPYFKINHFEILDGKCIIISGRKC